MNVIKIEQNCSMLKNILVFFVTITITLCLVFINNVYSFIGYIYI